MHNQTVRTMQANEGGRGNLAGFEIACTCGHRIGTSLASQVQTMVREHKEYWERREAAEKAAASKRKGRR